MQHRRDFSPDAFTGTGDEDTLLVEVESKAFWEFHGYRPRSLAFWLSARSKLATARKRKGLILE
jgi:hypothetical protein